MSRSTTLFLLNEGCHYTGLSLLLTLERLLHEAVSLSLKSLVIGCVSVSLSASESVTEELQMSTFHHQSDQKTNTQVYKYLPCFILTISGSITYSIDKEIEIHTHAQKQNNQTLSTGTLQNRGSNSVNITPTPNVTFKFNVIRAIGHASSHPDRHRCTGTTFCSYGRDLQTQRSSLAHAYSGKPESLIWILDYQSSKGCCGILREQLAEQITRLEI